MYYIEKKFLADGEAGEDFIVREPGKLDKLLNSALELLYPMSTYCLVCGKYINESCEYCLCDRCVREMAWGHVEIDLDKEFQKTGFRSELDSARACMRYGLLERQMIFSLKFDGHTYISRVLAKIMVDRILSDPSAAKSLLACDAIVPVPVHRSKLKKRGFNQTEKVSKHLSKLIGIPMETDFLVRSQNTKEQKSISGEERYMNLLGAFEVPERSKEKLAGKSLILLDDIYTTGATANISAAALKSAGAREVHLLVTASRNDFAHGYFEEE